MEFSEWMNKKYIAWRGDSRGTISEFAEFVGVKQQVMSSWMKHGGNAPNASSLAKIASKYGGEVYTVLGLPHPSQDISLYLLPPALRAKLEVALAEINSMYDARGFSAESPEAVALALEILGRHGFSVDLNSIKNPG